MNDQPDCLEIDTRYFHMVYDKKQFSQNHLYIDIKYGFTNYGGRWYYGCKNYGNPPRNHNLKGTARTLDRANGEYYMDSTSVLDCEAKIDLGWGLCDSSGRTFFEDGESLAIEKDGWVYPRKPGCIDTYFLGYGRDYFKAIHEFYRLSGPVPLLPRYALGNWWSRYWKYTEETYKELLLDFERRKLPFSVAVMDMDWHLVNIPERFGKGWTGYTWNRDFFPEPERFLNWLHEHGYRITLNLHPADGVRAFEEQYLEMAAAMNIDPESEYPVRFDFTNIEFVKAYFQYLHHPNEEKGVDFWWMDWQQGKVSAVEGMDPLWMLNHYHHFDLKRNGKRGIMASRYGGLGSHRYPIGFSGDTQVTWASLEYQPYFTATAANVGYTWWSHDIGGHHHGIRDNELYVRWFQYGVFSPINRIHGGWNPFIDKNPSNYPSPYREIAEDALRLRHRLLPYLYTMNYQCHHNLAPIVVPVYYHYPMLNGSYKYRNEYFFGDQLLVQPMVHPTNPETVRTAEDTWLPPGDWMNVYDGACYHGGTVGKSATITRPISQQGVLAKAGAIIPMADIRETGNDIGNPEILELYVFPGDDNLYEMYEDEGDGFGYEQGVFLKTKMQLCWDEYEAAFTIRPEGDFSVVPAFRQYVVHFRGFADVKDVMVSETYKRQYDDKTRTLTITLEKLASDRIVEITLKGELRYRENRFQERAFELLNSFQGSTDKKSSVYHCLTKDTSDAEKLAELKALDVPESWEVAVSELIMCR